MPILQGKEKKTPRIVILHEAASYVKQLSEKQLQLEKAMQSEVERKEQLLKRLEAHLYRAGN